jgi:hypothetical protein
MKWVTTRRNPTMFETDDDLEREIDKLGWDDPNDPEDADLFDRRTAVWDETFGE